MKVPTFIYPAGKDINGRLWLFDARERRIFVEGDNTSRSERGYPCNSFQQAKRMVKQEEGFLMEAKWKDFNKSITAAGKERYERNLDRIVHVLESNIDSLYDPTEIAEKILKALALDSYKSED